LNPPREVVINGIKLFEHEVTCPECGALMSLRPSKYGLFYGCIYYPTCKSAHGAHPDGAPLGVPTTKEGKLARIRAHDAFDKLWNNGRKDGSMSRKAAYRWMQAALGMTKEEAHIGKFDIATCERLIAVVTAYLKGEGVCATDK